MKIAKSIVSIQTGVAVVALLCLGQPLGAAAGQLITAKFGMPMQVNGRVTASDCENSPGPQITLEGEIALGGVQVGLIFQNNLKGTHLVPVTYSSNVVLVALGDAITLDKQPVLGGVGGNPHIWIQFHDGEGKNLCEEIYLGRCVQGLAISSRLLNEVLAEAEVDAADCSNHPGPIITVGGTMTFSGLHARFIFRNNFKGTHTAEEMRDVELIVKGSQIVLPKQPVRGGAGGNPLISVGFLQGDGTPIEDPVMLGRCNHL